ncbi:hypothetical protein BGZ98_002437 [Dissophora globulifera]|nr:hypothetical protein BGZ98_002437 [Dissophora globulifera]
MDSIHALAQPLLDFVQPITLSPYNLGVQITSLALPCLLLVESLNSQSRGRYLFKPLASLGFILAALAYIPTSYTHKLFHLTSSSSPTSFATLDDIPKTIASIGLPNLFAAYIADLRHLLFSVAPTVLSAPSAATSFAVSSSSASAAIAAGAVVYTTYTKAMMLAFGLGFLGDVLLIPKWGFLPGLVSFLLGHAAFMVAFTFHGQDAAGRQLGIGLVVAVAAVVGPWLLPKIKNRIMRGAVIAYMLVISGMVLTAFGSINSGRDHLPERVVGAVMFFLSDLFVARQQFATKSVFNKWIGLPLYYVAQLLLASTLRGERI